MNNNIKLITIFTISLMLIIAFATISYATYTSQYAEPYTLIRKGSTGTGVKWVQDMLNHCGYNLTVDGDFGTKTYLAVTNFQTNKGLSVDGIVGLNTRNALKNSAYSFGSASTINGYMYTTARVNFRTGPGNSYYIKNVLEKASKVYVYQVRADGWAYAKYNNSYGYIYRQYLSSSAPSTNTNTTNTTSNSLPIFQRTNYSLSGIIKACKAYYSNNHFVYSTANGARTIPADKSKLYNGYYCVDCSSYVSWVLYEYGLINGKTDMQNYFSYQRSSMTFANIGYNGGNNYLSVVSAKNDSTIDLSKARPGDILVSNGHVEFFDSYTQNGSMVTIKVYNCGSNSSIQSPRITTSATRNINDITYILRVK